MTQRHIGLTGGIAMGKTTVSDYLATRYHLPILDADHFAREAVTPGSFALGCIVDRYGQHLLLPEGTLDRAQLGSIIFNDPKERAWVENLIHPYVRDCFTQSITALADQAVLVLAIPLLFEAGLTHLVSEIWLVTCPSAQQRDRLQSRGLTPDQAQARIASQWPIAQKIPQADVVLDNSGSLASLYAQIDRALAP